MNGVVSPPRRDIDDREEKESKNDFVFVRQMVLQPHVCSL